MYYNALLSKALNFIDDPNDWKNIVLVNVDNWESIYDLDKSELIKEFIPVEEEIKAKKTPHYWDQKPKKLNKGGLSSAFHVSDEGFDVVIGKIANGSKVIKYNRDGFSEGFATRREWLK
jgi:hypothetical protein